jgi:hypothetical protein
LTKITSWNLQTNDYVKFEFEKEDGAKEADYAEKSRPLCILTQRQHQQSRIFIKQVECNIKAVCLALVLYFLPISFLLLTCFILSKATCTSLLIISNHFDNFCDTPTNCLMSSKHSILANDLVLYLFLNVST